MSLIGYHPPELSSESERLALAELEVFAIGWSRHYGDFLPDIRDDLSGVLDRVDVRRSVVDQLGS